MDWNVSLGVLRSINMELGYISSGNIPGISANSIQVYRMAHGFSMNGLDVDLITSNIEPETDVHEFYGGAGFSITKIGTPLGKYLPARIREYFYHQNVKFHVDERAFDIIYTRIPSMLRLIKGDLPCVLELHKSDLQEWEIELIRSKSKLVLITISDVLKTQLESILGMEVRILPDAATEIEFSGKVDKEKVLFTGHLYENRGIDQLLRVAPKIPMLQFDIIGGREQDIRKWKKLNSNPNVKFMGFVPPAQVATYQAKAGILLINYSKKLNTAQYCSPLKLMEYIATGNLVVCTKFGPVVEEYKKLLHVCAADDDDELVALLTDIQQNYDQYSKKQKATLAKQGVYTWTQRAREVLSFL